VTDDTANENIIFTGPRPINGRGLYHDASPGGRRPEGRRSGASRWTFLPAIRAFSGAGAGRVVGHHEATKHAREKTQQQQQGSTSDSQASPNSGTNGRNTVT
jgi:hypothetical protein